MTIKERIDAAIYGTTGDNAPACTEAIDELIRAAYWRGKHDGAKEACDKAGRRYKAQRKAARECRYYKMALAIVEEPGAEGVSEYPGIYVTHPDYNSDTAELFGEDAWLGDDKL